MTKLKPMRPLPRLAMASVLIGAAVGAQAAPVTIKYTFDNAANTSYANPGLDATIAIDPALLKNFSAWSDSDGTLLQTSPIAPGDGLNGQGGTGRAVAARSWHDTNSFLFSFEVAAGALFSINQISFWQQGSSGSNGLGPTSWTLSINGTQVGNGTATRGGSGAVMSLNSGLPTNLVGTVAFAISATGAQAATTGSPPQPASNSTWRVDNFTITGDVTPVPVPAAAWLFGSAIAGLAGLRRRAG